MKKIISLLLILAMVFALLGASSVSAADEHVDEPSDTAVFEAGDVLYLRADKMPAWTQDSVLYVNFSDFSRADNGGLSIVIAEADPAKVDPKTGVVFDSDKGLYKYTVTEAEAGAKAMRFWRGSTAKLWNCSVVITAEDYAKGLNTAVVTDWTDSGYTEETNEYKMSADLYIPKTNPETGESFTIVLNYAAPNSTDKTVCEIFVNDKKVSDSDTYEFTADGSGIFTVKGTVTALDGEGGIIAEASDSGTVIVGLTPVLAISPDAVYAHASRGSKDREAWVKWRFVDGTYYIFLPNTVNEGEPVELFSSFSGDITVGEAKIAPLGIEDLTPAAGKEYTFVNGKITASVVFMYSRAESALFVNNTDDFDGMDFFSYLQDNKENSVSASGAVTNASGAVTGVSIKKMKGRGNTSWNADKKGFNVTLKDTIELAGMEKCKKFSLISNFQDAALARNRILYDLSDEVGVPYASDSRFIDLYTNGVYQGSYQMCQKIEVGKNTLMPDIDGEDYLDKETGGVKPDFSFVTEIDSSPAEDDFHFTVKNGNNLTMKSPELSADDQNIAAVRGYVKGKYNSMYDRLSSRADDVGDYIDLDSLAKVYLINELGKNWDSGATSFFLTYKPDENGNYKFFASPVWDYDNSLGNANGIERDLRNMGITDYTLPTGWFSTKKNGYNGPNFLATAAKHPLVMDKVYEVWFEEFVPAVEKLNSSGESGGEIYSYDVYRKILRDSAGMNYVIWPIVTNTAWIADHSALQRWGVSYIRDENGRITAADAMPFRSITHYDQYTFDGQYDYLIDWLNSRAAWMSGQYIGYYNPAEPYEPTEQVRVPTEPAQVPTEDIEPTVPAQEPTGSPQKPTEKISAPDDLFGDVNLNGEVDILDATQIQRHLAGLTKLSERQLRVADACRDGEVDILDATRIQRYLVGYVKAL